jgi:hypothetical protein
MRVDPPLLRTEKLTLVLKAIDGDKVRVYSASLDSPLVVLTNQALKVLAIDERLHVRRTPRSAEFLNIDSWPFPMRVTDRQRSDRM